MAEGVLARGWATTLPGYTLAPDASLTQITKELRTELDWFAAQAGAHGIAGPVILSGWSTGGCKCPERCPINDQRREGCSDSKVVVLSRSSTERAHSNQQSARARRFV